MRQVLERIPIEQCQIPILPRLERPHPLRHAQDPGCVDRNAGQCLIGREPKARSDRCLEQHHPGLGDVGLISALERHREACRPQLRDRLHGGVLHQTGIPDHRRMHHDRNLRRLELVHHQVALGRAIEHQTKAELAREPERGLDVPRAFGRHQRGDLAGQHVGQDIEVEVAGHRLLRGRGRALLGVLLRLDELLPQHCDPLGPAAGGLGRKGLLHFGPYGHRHHRGRVEDVTRGEHLAGLHDHRLAADQGARTMAGVNGRDPVVTQPADQELPRVVRVHRPEVGLNRVGLLQLVLVERRVQRTRETDHRVRVDQPRCHHLGIEHPIALRDGHAARRTDPLDRPRLPHQHDAVLDRGPRHGVHGLAPHRDLGLEPAGVRQHHAGRTDQRAREAPRRQPAHRPSPSSAPPSSSISTRSSRE